MSELGDLVAWIKTNLELISEAHAAATTAVESLNTGRTHLKWVMEGAENDYPAQAVGSLNAADEDLDAFLTKLDGITRTFEDYLARIAPGLGGSSSDTVAEESTDSRIGSRDADPTAISQPPGG